MLKKQLRICTPKRALMLGAVTLLCVWIAIEAHRQRKEECVDGTFSAMKMRTVDELVGAVNSDIEMPLGNSWMLNESEISKAEKRVISHPDHTSIYVLWALRLCYPERYQQLPAKEKAQILCSVLGRINVCDDWGYLYPPGAVCDREPAKALVDTGETALTFLNPILDDRTNVPGSVSMMENWGKYYSYRRCDFAYRYICLILSVKPQFEVDLQKRDEEITRLRSTVRVRLR